MKDFRANPPIQIRRNGKLLLKQARLAKTLGTRLLGLLGSRHLDAGEGLLIGDCKQVHTFFMRYTIDVVFLDSDHKILRTQTLRPWRISPYVRRARSVLELQAGFNRKHALQTGETLEVKA